mgnify:CR=1 FL=1|jgi:hypothetical protein
MAAERHPGGVPAASGRYLGGGAIRVCFGCAGPATVLTIQHFPLRSKEKNLRRGMGLSAYAAGFALLAL